MYVNTCVPLRFHSCQHSTEHLALQIVTAQNNIVIEVIYLLLRSVHCFTHFLLFMHNTILLFYTIECLVASSYYFYIIAIELIDQVPVCIFLLFAAL
uniref:Uncharacterized protein n=1 Tax=Ciona savignyi TaxID=51511 RepID=H2ZCX3_CIOSA